VPKGSVTKHASILGEGSITYLGFDVGGVAQFAKNIDDRPIKWLLLGKIK
jgi:hypothetical protein